MRVLVLDGTSGSGRIALVERDPGSLHTVDEAEGPARGGAERLAGLLRTLLDAAGWDIASLGLIAAITGPGSFTGLRAALALAQGLALGAALPLQGVTTSEALRRTYRRTAAGDGDSAPLWCVGMARRDRVFLDRDEREGPRAFMLDHVPLPDRPVLLAGDASALVASHIRQRGGVARHSLIERPDAGAAAAVALDRLEGRLAPCAALPLYVDPPEARLPAAGLRPPPL